MRAKPSLRRPVARRLNQRERSVNRIPGGIAAAANEAEAVAALLATAVPPRTSSSAAAAAAAIPL